MDFTTAWGSQRLVLITPGRGTNSTTTSESTSAAAALIAPGRGGANLIAAVARLARSPRLHRPSAGYQQLIRVIDAGDRLVLFASRRDTNWRKTATVPAGKGCPERPW
ncbi:hypothetical protein SSP35_27_00010 [Streptomyces sp. NBRC 110611]|uniref:hypothetical protein n=1 Tax=Streptomyces sp. NBRC 110611 TaxID=1621259 RepID=UPI0008558301|nr:hypothetical protein [Streptomyces sp. NBRC 110611]GAU71080.1 hypothetical protein SSP35_27_00010 [Streptomyces sp. NBRC 110611]